MASDSAVKFTVTVGTSVHTVRIQDRNGQGMVVGIDGETVNISPSSVISAQDSAKERMEDTNIDDEGEEGAVRSPIPGVVTDILVRPGDEVEAGQPLCILLAMKMSNEICSSRKGTIRMVQVTVGQAVQQGQVLIDYA